MEVKEGLGWLGDSGFHDNHEISKNGFSELWQNIMSNPIRSAHDKAPENLVAQPCHAIWLSSAQRTPGLIDEAHFVHIFGHSCNILGTGWITFHDKAKVFSGCGFLKRPYVIVSPRITLIQRLLKYSPLPDFPPFQIMV